MTRLRWLILLLVVIEVRPVLAQTAQTKAALENYRRVMNGKIRLGELSRQEQADVAQVDRRIAAQEIRRLTPEQRCYARELRSLGADPSYLARRSAAMRCGITFEEAEASLG